MTFAEKLIRLTECSNCSAIARKAGIGASKLWNYMHLGQMPNSATAVRLARALGVDCGWLIDDSKSWPPVRVEQMEQAAAHVAAA